MMNWAERGSAASVWVDTLIRCEMASAELIQAQDKRQMSILRKRPIFRWSSRAFLPFLLLCAQQVHAQTPMLARSAAHVGITSGQTDSGNNFTFGMEPAGSPRGVTAGETIIFFGTWPSANPQTFTDNASNSWHAVFSPASSCQDSASLQHGFFYASNVSASTSLVTESSTGAFRDTVMDFARFYNMAISSPLDGSSCATAVIPTSNTAPNITGTAFTTTANNDLIITCVFDVSQPLTVPNAWTSITYPANFSGLSDEPIYGHACAYWVQPTAGSFTPTFTVSQSTHDTFVIISAAFKAGTGGAAPGPGPSPVISEMQYVTQSGTLTYNLPCPVGTTNITIMNETGAFSDSITGVTDSGGNTYSHPTDPDNFKPQIYYTNSPTISNPNTFKISLAMSASGGVDLIGLFCTVGSAGIDTALTPANGSTLTGVGEGATYNTSAISGGIVAAVSSGTPSVAGDLIYDAGSFGQGPTTGCANNSCVYDYVGATWSGANGGDQETYANGDFMGHFYDSSTATVSFQFTAGPAATSGGTGMMLALKSGSASAPAPPTNLQATVQ
jgi:hypothetical protein